MCSAVPTHVLQRLQRTGSLSCALQTVYNGTVAHKHFQLSHCDCLVCVLSRSSLFASLAFGLLLFCSLRTEPRSAALSQYILRVAASTARRTLNSLWHWPPNLYAATNDEMSVNKL